MSQTVVVGAGLTGLSAGYALQRSGRDVVILERADGVGGLARSLDLDGFVFDLGPHYFFLKHDPRSDALVKACLGDRAQVLPFQVSAMIKNRNVAWPPNLKDLFRLPLSSTLTFLKNSLVHRFPQDKDCRGFITRFYGRAIYEDFVGPYIAKKVPSLGPEGLHREWWLQVARDIHNRYKGVRHDEMKQVEARKRVPLWVRARVLFNLLRGIVITALAKQRREVLYPEGGMGNLSKALAQKFEEAGGRILLNAGSVDLSRSEKRITGVTCDGRSFADPQSVIWTGSIHQLSDRLGLAKPDLPFEKIVLGFVKIKKILDLPPYLYTYYADPGIVFNRAYFPRLIHSGLVPDGKDAICVELSPGSVEGEALDKEGTEKAIVEGLERVSLCRTAEIEALSLLEVPQAYPVYPLDYYDTLQQWWEAIRPIENLWSVGRSGQFYYNNMTRTISMGLDLADHLLKAERSAPPSSGDDDPPR